MKDYLIRMGEELNQLKERLDKLTKFIDNNEIFFNLTVEKRSLLYRQQFAMKDYYNILKKRLTLEEDENNGM